MILPMIDVPVSLVGTFAVLAVLGFSLNNLTLFGLVLAIGIVVDDAIVVLENIERLIATGLDARTATIQAMDELTGPIVAITLVLSSVFLPSIFIPGPDGAVLPPVCRHHCHGRDHFGHQRVDVDPLAGRLDLPHRGDRRTGRTQERGASLVDLRHAGRDVGTVWLAGRLSLDRRRAPRVRSGDDELAPLGPAGCLVRSRSRRWAARLVYYSARSTPCWRHFSRPSIACSSGVTAVYGWMVGRLARLAAVVGIVYCGLLLGTWWGVTFAPRDSFRPRTRATCWSTCSFPTRPRCSGTGGDHHAHRQDRHKHPGRGAHGRHLRHVVSLVNEWFQPGFDVRRTQGLSERTGHDEYDATIAEKIQQRCARRSRGQSWASFAPPIRGLGNAGGFQLQTEQIGTFELHELQNADRSARANGSTADPHFAGVFTVFAPPSQACSWTSTALRSRRCKSPFKTSSRRSTSTWADCTSTNSMNSG